MAMQMKKELAMLELVCQVSHILSLIKFFVGNMFFLVSLIETNYLRAKLFCFSNLVHLISVNLGRDSRFVVEANTKAL